MISEFVAYLAGIIISMIYCFYSFRKNYPFRKVLYTLIFILYLTCVAAITLFPMQYDTQLNNHMSNLEYRLELIPFETIWRFTAINNFYAFFVQIIGNIVMTIPFGFLMPVIAKNRSKRFYILHCLALPLIIEFSQFFIGFLFQTFYRTADIDDVILNFCGAMIGLLIFRLVPDRIKKFLRLS